MTMASPPPSEEERRLLREYRVTHIPPRRSCTSAEGIQTNISGTQTNISSTQTNPRGTQHGNHSHHKHHSGHHHHHHHNNHRRNKNSTPTHELTADELNRMLELASDLDYLKLVPAGKIETMTNDSGSAIFKKVDYIKMIHARRKAFKKMKKARGKGRVPLEISNQANSIEDPNSYRYHNSSDGKVSHQIEICK